MSRVGITSVPSTCKMMSPICTPAASAARRGTAKQARRNAHKSGTCGGLRATHACLPLRSVTLRTASRDWVCSGRFLGSSLSLLSCQRSAGDPRRCAAPREAGAQTQTRERERERERVCVCVRVCERGLPGPPGSITVMMGTGGNPETPHGTESTRLSRQLPGTPHSRREIRKEMEEARVRSRCSRQRSPRYSNPMPRDIAPPAPVPA
jgi:hypothetical protein